MKSICGFVLAVLLALPLSGSAREFTAEDRLLCDAKMTVAEYAYRHRNFMPKKDMFQVLDQTWDERWTSLDYASYVDMKRIIEDAYRRQKGGVQGGYRRPACEKGKVEACTVIVEGNMKDECHAALRQGF